MQKPGLFGMNGLMVFLLSCLTFVARGQQQGYLILLEAENKQAFSVRMGDQVFISTAQGHLVLSQLRDSVYKLYIRFTKKNMYEQTFPVVIHGKDQGFQLKGGESAWVLYNWQTNETIHPLKENDSSRMLEQGVKRDDGFSRLMAAVVNDSSVMYDTYSGAGFSRDSASKNAQSLKQKAESRVPVTDSVRSLSQSSGDQSHQQSTSVPPPAIVAPSAVAATADKKLKRDSLQALKKTNDSLILAAKLARKDSLIAVHRAKISSDSLRAVNKQKSRDSLLAVKTASNHKDSLNTIPSTANRQPSTDIPSTANSQPPTVIPPPPTANRQPSTDIPSTANRQPPANLSPGVKKLREVSLKISRKMVFLDVANDGVADTITLFVYFETNDTGSRKEPVGAPAQAARKTACTQQASEADAEFLRSAILKANSEDEKIAVATSAFDQRCFSVNQIRQLAALLISDKAKYRLMDAARLHIVDPDHFHELVNMYTDRNFQRKFLTMADKGS
jgi:hypothetical protein